MRVAMYGRPGPTYVELPVLDLFCVPFLDIFVLSIKRSSPPQAEVIYDMIDESKLVLPRPIPPPPLTFADPHAIQSALGLLKTAKNPLVIVGKVREWQIICLISGLAIIVILTSSLFFFRIQRVLLMLVLRTKPAISCTPRRHYA